MIVIIKSPWRNWLAQTVSTRKVRGSTPLGDTNLNNKKARRLAGFYIWLDYVNLKLLVTTDVSPYEPVDCNDAVYGPALVYVTAFGDTLVEVKLDVPNVHR